ncbi:hypothetical protein LR48_Vigan11g120000 [Vigna angularis]|uniref:Uncharacterized protein n=1 Tax=Phaseolus angularis TaxID=3914 RepID=A0A0L9VSW5_PHAAN|nr:hypothetical protein LR48_Vigan11g119900 [Vigna angularis]KOM58166.1 hypothetical protein LR48_Vigan11g120000 [Vigna angularis]
MPIVFSRLKLKSRNHYSSSQATRNFSVSPFTTILCLAIHHRSLPRRSPLLFVASPRHCITVVVVPVPTAAVVSVPTAKCPTTVVVPAGSTSGAVAAVSRERDLSFSLLSHFFPLSHYFLTVTLGTCLLPCGTKLLLSSSFLADKLGGRGTVRVVAALPPQGFHLRGCVFLSGGWRRDHGWQLKEFAIEAHGCACEEDELANRSGAILGSFMVVRLRGDFGNTFEFETLDNNAEENAIRGYGLRG